MATSITVKGRTTRLADVFAQITSGITNAPSPLDFGNILIIDDGAGQGYSEGIGVDGAGASGINSVYEFSVPEAMKAVIRDGEIYQLAAPLFKPAEKGVPGASKVSYIKAAHTTQGTLALTFAKSSLSLKTKGEGTAVNGALVMKTYTTDGQGAQTVTSNDLFKGYAARLEKGKAYGYSLVFYRGVNGSADPLNANTSYDGTVAQYSYVPGVNTTYRAPVSLFRSPDLYNARALKKWLDKSPDVKRYFGNVTVTFTGTNEFDDAFVNADSNQFTALAPFGLVAGATETYDDAAFQLALVAAKSVDNTFFLAVNYGDDAQTAHNVAIQDLIESNQLKYEKYLVVAGGFDDTEFDEGTVHSSIDTAQFYNSSSVIVVHGGAKVADRNQSDGFRTVSQLYKAAAVLGRICGLEPQASVTMKSIAIDAEIHTLTEGDGSQKEAAVEFGVVYTNYDLELNAFVVGFGVNTLQDADFLVDDDARSYDIAVERIKSQINKEIIFAAKKRFFGDKSKGANRNTVSPDDIVAWLGGFLDDRVATPQQDNLIIRWQNIVVTYVEDNLYVTFEFVPNYPVNRIIFNGVMLAS
jgi:hypothetical protein